MNEKVKLLIAAELRNKIKGLTDKIDNNRRTINKCTDENTSFERLRVMQIKALSELEMVKVSK